MGNFDPPIVISHSDSLFKKEGYMKIRIALLTCLAAAAMFAADATGKWSAEVAGRGGQTRTVTMSLKADGAKLTGTVGGPQGDTEITDGKVDGDTITFTVTREFQGNSMKVNYTGKVAGDEIKFKSEMAGGQRPPQEFTAKRSIT